MHHYIVRSWLLYCIKIWCTHLKKDFLTIKQVQRCATKHNFYQLLQNLFTLKLNLLPLMYMFKLQFTIISIKSLSTLITTHIKFSPIGTRSVASNKLIPPRHINNTVHPVILTYFHCMPYLWNSIPTFDLNISFCGLKIKLKREHFKSNFDINSYSPPFLSMLQMSFINAIFL